MTQRLILAYCSQHGEHGVQCEQLGMPGMVSLKGSGVEREVHVMEIFVHRREAERIALVTVEAEDNLGHVLNLQAEEFAWVENAEDVLDPTMTVGTAGIRDRAHVHVNSCRKVDVGVRFNGETKSKGFPPSALIRSVYEWATGEHGFKLSETDRAEHTFQVCGSNIQPEPSDHVGSFVADDNCEACFDLVPKHRFEG